MYQRLRIKLRMTGTRKVGLKKVEPGDQKNVKLLVKYVNEHLRGNYWRKRLISRVDLPLSFEKDF